MTPVVTSLLGYILGLATAFAILWYYTMRPK
jgi:hypothetical protein